MQLNYMAELYGLQHMIKELLLPDETIEIHDTPLIGEFTVHVKGPGYGARLTFTIAGITQTDFILEWLKRELEKVRADWRKV